MVLDCSLRIDRFCLFARARSLCILYASPMHQSLEPNPFRKGRTVQAFSFDANGNLLSTGVMTHTFDAANRLLANTAPRPPRHP